MHYKIHPPVFGDCFIREYLVSYYQSTVTICIYMHNISWCLEGLHYKITGGSIIIDNQFDLLI